MKDEDIQIEDHSGDRKYFTMIPNYIRNHSTAIDQALYFNMKSYAGDNGTCFVSKRNLASKMGIGRTALTKSIKYLIDHKWIAEVGFKTIKTSGGDQKVSVYRINDIWALNQAFYSQGGSETAPLSDSKVGLKQQGGGSETATKKIDNKEDNTSNFSNLKSGETSSLSEGTVTTPPKDTRFDSVAELDKNGDVLDPKNNPKNIPFNFSAYMAKLKNSNKESYKILHLYWSYKKINIQTLKQVQLQYGMDIKFAEALSGYPRQKIVEAFKLAKDESEEKNFDWKLSTVFKKITTIQND
jgi:hypothetical protein